MNYIYEESTNLSSALCNMSQNCASFANAISAYLAASWPVEMLLSQTDCTFCDAAEPWGMYFQDSASPIMEGIVDLHDHISYFIILILTAVTWMMAVLLFSSYVPKGFTKSTPYNSVGEYEIGTSLKDLNHGSVIEVVWTISPAIILVLIAFPSFRLLYLMDEMIEPTITIKAVGFFILSNQNLKGGHKLYISNKIKDALGFKFRFYSGALTVRPGISNLQHNGLKNRIWRKSHFKSNPLQGALGALTVSKNGILPLMGARSKWDTRSFHLNCRAINRIGPHNIDVISVIVGSLLGDAYAQNRSGEGIRLSYRQSVIHKEYLLYLWHFFYEKGYTTPLKPRMYTRIVGHRLDKTYYGYEFNLLTFRSLNVFIICLNKNGKKVLNKELGNYISPRSLAVWIMDDGGKAGDGLRLSCNAFSYMEVLFLKEILEKNFSLNCTIQKIYIKNRFSIYIKKNSIKNLRTIVMPYMHQSMIYKLY